VFRHALAAGIENGVLPPGRYRPQLPGKGKLLGKKNPAEAGFFLLAWYDRWD